jgi:hypothetical protein
MCRPDLGEPLAITGHLQLLRRHLKTLNETDADHWISPLITRGGWMS